MKDVELSSSRVLSYVMMTSLAVVAVGLWYAYHRVKYSRFYELGDLMPGPRALPIIGNANLVWGLKATGK